MSYPKKPTSTARTLSVPKTNTKLSEEKRELLLAIQERERLKGLMVNKFVEKYGKDKSINQTYIDKHVNELMKNENLTEDNLKKLEQKIKNGTNIKTQVPTQKGENSPRDLSIPQSVSQFQQVGQGQNYHGGDDAVSVASSRRPKSIYAQGEDDDEWATMAKYDAELHRKEKHLEMVREKEQKRKIKEELDRQIKERKRVQEVEEKESNKYVGLVGQQMKEAEQKEKKKEHDMKNKIMQEKYSRDRQLQDEYQRKKVEKKTEKELDTLLVNKIKEELEQETRDIAMKRQYDRQNFKKVLSENEENKKKMIEDARREKEADTRAQQEYTKLIEKQEAERAAKLKAREERAKKLMNMMADTVVKDQKTQILEDERKLLKQIIAKEAKEVEEDKRKQQRLNEQKKEMRSFLDLQMQEKERKRQEELEGEKRQAEVWRQDVQEFNHHEQSKSEYLKDVNMQHAEFLKKQIVGDQQRHKKMNTEELLINKPKLKEIAAIKAGDASFNKKLVNSRNY